MIIIKSNNFVLDSIKGVIFDKDGTITDSHKYWSKIIKMRAALIMNRNKINRKYYPDLCKSMGLNIQTNKLLPVGPIALKSREEVINNVLVFLKSVNYSLNFQSINNHFIEVNNDFSKISNDYIKPIKPCINLIHKLHQLKVKLSIVTSDTTQNAELVCEKLKISSCFDFIIGGDQKTKNKSSGEPAIHACRLMDLDTKDIICIGDALMDFEMSENAKLKGSILVASGQIPLENLLKYSKNCVGSLSEIKIEN